MNVRHPLDKWSTRVAVVGNLPHATVAERWAALEAHHRRLERHLTAIGRPAEAAAVRTQLRMLAHLRCELLS